MYGRRELGTVERYKRLFEESQLVVGRDAVRRERAIAENP